MEQTVARATRHIPALVAEGRHSRPDWTGRRGHHWESGEGKRRLWLGHFHRHECARSSSSFVRIEFISLVRQRLSQE